MRVLILRVNERTVGIIVSLLLANFIYYHNAPSNSLEFKEAKNQQKTIFQYIHVVTYKLIIMKNNSCTISKHIFVENLNDSSYFFYWEKYWYMWRKNMLLMYFPEWGSGLSLLEIIDGFNIIGLIILWFLVL